MELARVRNQTMPWTLAGSAAVVVAQQFNPSIVTQLWLVNNRVLAADDFQDGSLYSDYVVQVRSRLFNMLVVPEQLQFVPVGPPEGHQHLIVEKLGTIVRTLPHTPYRALGLNFSWLLTPASGDVGATTRGLFFHADRPLYQHFREDNAQYGGYLSKDFAGFRLRLDIKSILFPGEGGQENRIQFVFNFHRDAGDGGAGLIEECLRQWDEVRYEAERIIDSVEERRP
jgi:hypothetical protein